ncbi:MAG: hypothetical protein EHM93_19460 [Bacteroidales bacterium]|nr:MAG: hypothetical protein EHM93_19460 [Bacteroidales bacterium]
MRTIKYLTTLRKELIILLIISILLIILVEFTDFRLPIFVNNAAKWNLLGYNLSIAYLASFIFYFIVVHIPNEKEKEKIIPYFKVKTNCMINSAKALLKVLKEETKTDFINTYPTRKELENLLEKVNPHQKAPMLISLPDKYANWAYYFAENSIRIKIYCEEILSKIKFIDSEFFNKIIVIDEHMYLKETVRIHKAMPIGNDESTYLLTFFHQFIQAIEELEKFTEKEFRNY